MKAFEWILVSVFASSVAAAQTASCDMKGYKPGNGIKAEAASDGVSFTWPGEENEQLRARFAIRDGQPVVAEMAARAGSGAWMELGKDLSPEFQVTTARRRISGVQRSLLTAQKNDSPEQENIRKWNTFWDAPLVMPGHHDSTDLPRKPEEIHRATGSYHTTQCSVTTDGARVSVTFNGLSLGVFAGDIMFTVYKGSNLLRQEAVAKHATNSPSPTSTRPGSRALPSQPDTKLVWRDTAQVWQEYRLRRRAQPGAGQPARAQPAGDPGCRVPDRWPFCRPRTSSSSRARTRSTSAMFTTARIASGSFSLGVMQPERGEGYPPWGVSERYGQRRVGTAREQVENYALYNAPPGTMQHMAVYYYLSPKGDHATQQAVLAYTHDDVFKPVPGFKVVTGHFHLDLNEMLRDRGTLDYRPTWVPVFRGLGINIVYLGDFHDDSDIRDPGPKRFMEQKVYFEGSQRLSDKNFLVMPAEEANAFLGGHWYLMTPKPVYFSHAVPRPANQPFEEEDPKYGTCITWARRPTC